METGIDLIGKEREEQKNKHGRTIEQDIKNNCNRELSIAASALLDGPADPDENILDRYPKNWDEDVVRKMDNNSYKSRLIIAGALIVAELDRIVNVELEFRNPILSPTNIEEWKKEFNTKMKLWYDLD